MISRLAALALAAALTIAEGAAAQAAIDPLAPSDAPIIVRGQNLAPASPDVFGTAAVNSGVTFYDARFRRVSRTDRNHPVVMALASSLDGLAPEQQLAVAQRAVLQRVRWMRDLDNMKVADFWSNAGETLERGTGDSEDIAIATMQVLRAAGWDARDLYVSIGRQEKLGQHIVLLAHTPSGFMMLDDKVGRPVSARFASSFTPILTIGSGRSWVHGQRRVSAGARSAAR